MILNWRRIFNNVLLATLIGLVIIFMGFESFVPDFVIQIASLLGAMTLPLIMLIIGGNIYIDYQKKGTLFLREISKFVIVKNIIFPIIFLGIVLIIRPAYHIAFLLLLQAAVPPVTAVPLFTGRAGGNQGIVNQFVVARFITSLITLPVMVTIFGYFFSV